MTGSGNTTHSWLDPAVVIGCAMAIALLVLLVIQPSTNWFEHPIRLERLGAVPANTTLGVTLFASALPFGAIAWFVTPFLLRKLGSPITAERERIARRDVLLLIGFLSLGGLIRALRLSESLWYDEIAAMLSFSIHGPGPALGNYYALSNHVLHSALASVSLELAGGASEPILRAPAMIFGLASIPAAYLLGREVRSPVLGLLLAAIITVMPVAVLESVEARGYSMMLCFAILSTWLLLRIELTGSSLAVFGYACVITLGIWSHLAFAFVALGHGFLAAWMFANSESRTASLRLLVGLALAGISSIVVLMPIMPDLIELRSEFRATDGNEPSIFGLEGFYAFLQLGGAWIWWAALPGFVLGILGIKMCLESPRARRALVASVLGGLVAVAFTIFGGSWIYARFLVFLLVASSLLIAMGIAVIARHGQTWGAIAAAIVLAGAWILDLAVRPPKQPIREAVEWVHQLAIHAGTNDVLSIGLMDDVASYYAQPLGLSLQKTGSLGDALPELSTAPDLGIVLYPDRLPVEIQAQLRESGYQEVGRFPGWLDWGHGDVVVLRRQRE